MKCAICNEEVKIGDFAYMIDKVELDDEDDGDTGFIVGRLFICDKHLKEDLVKSDKWKEI